MSHNDKLKFYSSEAIRATKARYLIVFGERSNGKTTDALQYAIHNAATTGKEFVYMRRWEEDIKGNKGNDLFGDINARGVIMRETKNEWEKVFYYNRKFYFARWDENLQKNILSNKPIGHAFAISTAEHEKGNNGMPNVTTVIFDEFLTRDSYLVNEFVDFCGLLSTIIRQRDDVTIFMLGNTVNQYCPYFREMGLTRIKEMKPGTIDVYEYGDSGLRVAVEYASGVSKKGKPSDVYFAFSNPRLRMVTSGAWELDIYPHLPQKYRPADILFTYFIQFDGETLQCEIIDLETCRFTYIHRKTSELRNPDEDTIYSLEYNPLPNWHRKILKPTTTLERNIALYFARYKIFYQDNEVGEIVRNYVQACNE